MAQPNQSLLDRAKRWFRLLTRRSGAPAIHPDQLAGGEFFTGAQDFNVNGGNFVNVNGDNFVTVNVGTPTNLNEVNLPNLINEWQTKYINDVVAGNQAVFELLEPYTCLDATKDSSARHPPPRCHPKTRLKIRERLTRWLCDECEKWKMLWVRGSAGTGKSAVAQSFGDSCGEEEKHGASYFFSRTTGRNKPETIVPTLVYQLATTVHDYRSLVAHKLVDNPLLLKKSSPVQFRELIVEPFATLQRRRPRNPIVIILDGLDECEGEKAQLEILEMVTNAVRSYPDLPLRWLIFSRPEAHLKNDFSLNSECGREELVIDEECLENVERYVKDRLVRIKSAYSDVTPDDWPLPDKLQELLDAVSGLFVFASTCLHFIDDLDKANPPSQLDSLLAFMRRSQAVVSRNPLTALDLLYSQILERIPPDVYKTTKQILAYMSHRDKVDETHRLGSAQALSNFLRLDRQTFYVAARGLHSVTRIPDPKDADQFQLEFYHASFQDFLLDPNRSGRFCITEQDALAVIVPLCVYWCDVDTTLFHTGEGWKFDYIHKHGCLPDLSWASEDNREDLSQSITDFFEDGVLDYVFPLQWDCADQDFLSQLSNTDFRCWGVHHIYLATLICRLDPSTSVIRVEPSSPTDYQLLEYLKIVIADGIAKPAQLPLRLDIPRGEYTRKYFFIGRGVKSVIVWRTQAPDDWGVHSLRCDEPPSEDQVTEYAEFLKRSKWDEARAEMK